MTRAELEAAHAPFLTDLQLRDLPEGPMLLARFDPGLLTGVDLPFSLPDHIARAVARRRAEFVAGRLLARLGQQWMGLDPAPVGISEGRVPLWPPGLAGSISHSAGRAAVWLTRRPGTSLGLDLEPPIEDAGLRAVQARVLDAVEISLLGPERWGQTFAFSGKETLFKALYPKVGRWFGFDAARVVAMTEDTLTLRLCQELAPDLPAGQCFELRVAREDGLALTWLAVPWEAERIT